MKQHTTPSWDIVAQAVEKVLRTRTSDASLIEEIRVSVLVACWDYLRRHEILNLEGFAATVALRKYQTWLRQRKHALLEWQDKYEGSATAEDPARIMDSTERSLVLTTLVDALPLPYREVIQLHLEGWKHARIARERKIPVGTVKTWFRKGKALLRQAGANYFLN